mgnify:CR=1 FL=1
MKIGQYTGITDVEKLVTMVLDDTLDTGIRTKAVYDLRLDYDFDWHRLLNFAADPTQPASVRGVIFDGQNWDERAMLSS